MSRNKWVLRDGKLVPIDELAEYDTKKIRTHSIINDIIDETWHPKDGRYYTSKSEFRKATKRYGCEEVGTAYENGWRPSADRPRDTVRDDIAKVISELGERYKS